MAADLSIHVLAGADETDLAEFFRNTLGSKWFAPKTGWAERDEAVWDRVAKTPSVWVGEVSWLKAAVLGDADAYVPSTVQAVQNAVGEDLPAVDDALVARIAAAFDLPNRTGYALADRSKVVAFLEAHRGERVFTVSW